MQLDDFTIRRVALAFSIVGLIAVAIASQFGTPKELMIHEINEKHVPASISTKGIVSWSKLSKGILLFGLKDVKEIKCVLFNPSPEDLSIIRKGMAVKVEGKVQLYKNSLEIIVRKVFEIESS